MARPRYTWWPWRTLALAVPVVSFGAAVFASLAGVEASERSTEKLTLLVGLTIFGAGNGFLLGAAIGDFGRSILAMIAGAAAALLAAPYAVGLGILLALLFVCAVITGTLALEWTLRGILEAVWSGLAGLLYGAVVGILASVVITYPLWLWWGPNTNASLRITILVLGIICPLMIGNLVFIGRIFSSSYRTESMEELSPSPTHQAEEGIKR